MPVWLVCGCQDACVFCSRCVYECMYIVIGVYMNVCVLGVSKHMRALFRVFMCAYCVAGEYMNAWVAGVCMNACVYCVVDICLIACVLCLCIMFGVYINACMCALYE